ncbi:MAG: hypothetical protein SFX18_03650 [Pirellulales bacterium]|nr:hypothetical protein [Pirellulales bacterium]
MFTVFLLAVFLIPVIMLSALGGLWDNLLTWINIILAGLIATNYFEPFAIWIDSMIGTDYAWYSDLMAFWILFAGTMGLLRAVTDTISTVRVRFRKPVEVAGSIIFAALCGWTLVCLTTFSLHLAPLAVNSFGGAFQERPETNNMFFGTGPDFLWLSFAHRQSRPDSGPISVDEQHIFDPQGLFRLKYGLRRYRFEQLLGDKGKPPVE